MAKKPVADPVLWGQHPMSAENPDPTPVALPLGYSHPESIEETVQRLLRSEMLARYAAQQGAETFEEFMDFGDESEDDPTTPHEEFWDPIFRRPTSLAELKKLDDTLRGGGTVQFSEDDAHALRLRLREIAREKAEIPPPDASGRAAPDIPADPPKPAPEGSKS